MPLRIVSLREEHLEDAAALACARYRALRERVPELPPRYELVETVFPLLRSLHERAPGVAAISRGRLAGFLAAWLVPDLRGRRAVFSPEWGNGARSEDGRRIYGEMYARLAERWIREGFFTHLIGMLAGDRQGIDGWHWLGFGLVAADGVRDLQPPAGTPAPVEIRRATVQDAGVAVSLATALDRHLAAAPTFLVHEEEQTRGAHERWLSEPANAMWLAREGGEAVAYMRLGPATSDACTIIRDAGTASITGAYTRPRSRGRGVATALLARSLEWAREQGYERCAVDFEPMNTVAARFWLAHFRPVSLSLGRHVDERSGRRRSR